MGHPRQQLNGPEGLLVAIIDQAVRDLKSGGPAAKSARLYFNSNLYQHHLQLLNLPADLQPEFITKELENMDNYLYANLSIGKPYEEGKGQPAGQPCQRANAANDSDYDYVGLTINADKATSQPAPAANGGDGYDYAGLTINSSQKKPAQPAKRKLQHFTNNSGYIGK